MPSTHLSLHYHLVFSTKDRIPIINTSWRERLHGYAGGIIKNMNGVPEAIGGTNDHIHLLIGLRATHCLADVVRDLKAGRMRLHEPPGAFAPG
jgi:REP element-mobilizing transposase RayT